MRKTFFKVLYEKMAKDDRIYAITGDLGYIGFDHIRDNYRDRFLNCGSSEQAMIGIAIGLALQGKIPFVYSITPFLLFRPFETIRNYLHHEQANVKLIGSGWGTDYQVDGYSHHPIEALQVYRYLNIKFRIGQTKQEIPVIVDEMVTERIPYILILRR